MKGQGLWKGLERSGQMTAWIFGKRAAKLPDPKALPVRVHHYLHCPPVRRIFARIFHASRKATDDQQSNDSPDAHRSGIWNPRERVAGNGLI